MVKITESHFEMGRKKESLKDLCEINPEWDYDRLLLKTGIKNRYILDSSQTPEELSFEAGRKCIEKVDASNIDGIIYVTQSPSQPLPTRACYLQEKLKLPTNSLAFDINQGCSGFVYALSLANSLINTNNLNSILIK